MVGVLERLGCAVEVPDGQTCCGQPAFNTGALAGLADTGSLALLSGPTRPRAASLLPLVHIALLPVRALYPTMAQFLAAHPGLTRQASNLVFITGPSRTADIEMVITRGVHGPKALQVVLLRD